MTAPQGIDEAGPVLIHSSVTRSGFTAATVERSGVDKFFTLEGKVSGHATGAWLPADNSLATKIPAPMAAAGGSAPPVVAILDTGIQSHSWLEEAGQPLWSSDPEFSLVVVAPPQWCPHQIGQSACYGSHAGHATFLAGLVRQAAPDAGLLSYQVMDIHGQATDDRIIAALDQIAEQNRVSVVLMAFGRDGTFDEPDIVKLRAAVARVVGLGIRVVAAAGNDGSTNRHYPAAFAADDDLGGTVIAVGGLQADNRSKADFSNGGPWIRAWRQAVNVYSAMPWRPDPLQVSTALPEVGRLDERLGAGDDVAVPADVVAGLPRGSQPLHAFAWWSGTSFAAARYAGELANRPDGSLPVMLPSSPAASAAGQGTEPPP